MAIAGLAVSIHRLSSLEAERTQLLAWQGRILRQLGSAVSINPAYEGSLPLPAADASEALADIVGTRDDALKRLAMPRPDQIRMAGPEAMGASGRAPPPPEITQLLNRQSTGAAGSDVQAIDHDSQSPWKGWE